MSDWDIVSIGITLVAGWGTDTPEGPGGASAGPELDSITISESTLASESELEITSLTMVDILESVVYCTLRS